MLAADAIRPSQSPFSLNVVEVRKKDGTIRLRVDYRKLNNRTIKDAQAIPRIEDTLHLLAVSKYFTKLDLRSGYWQVELRDTDKAKTAFQVRTMGYYRRFTKDYARIARPLNDLLTGHCTNRKSKTAKSKKKRTPFTWTEKQQEAFDTLRDKIINPPVLAYADYRLPFKLHTDASTMGLGAVLYQHQDGQDRVVAYASRSLKTSERNYPAHKLEFLALKWAITDKFHDYLYSATFDVLTDNNPLTYVFTTAKLDATGQRWLAELSNYNCSISYRS